jgi:hypothetical protein
MKDIKKIAKEMAEQNGKVTQKELIWFLVSLTMEQDKRISKVEAKQEALCWFIPVFVGLTALVAHLL